MFDLRFTPDDYSMEPELWLANTLAHIGLGIWLAIISCGAWLYSSGEFPERAMIAAMITFLYLLYEITNQGWRGFDTVEDTVFVTIYGAGGALYCFTEVYPGSAQITASIFDLVFASTPPIVHMAIGSYIRASRRSASEELNSDAK